MCYPTEGKDLVFAFFAFCSYSYKDNLKTHFGSNYMINEKIQNSKAIVFGRFQPLTKAHYNMIKDIVSKYQEVFVLPVQGAKAYKSSRKTEKGKRAEMSKKLGKSPFPVGLRQKMILKSIPELDDRHVFKSEVGSIEKIYNKLKKTYPKKDFSTIDVYAGVDEYESYQRQARDMTSKEEYENVEVNVYRYEEGTRRKTEKGLESEISATKVRSSLTNNNWNKGFEKYKEVVAPPLATREWYDKLREVLMKLQNKETNESLSNLFDRIDEEGGKKDTIKTGHFKHYDEYYYSNAGYHTGSSESEEDSSSRIANKKVVDDLQKYLWKQAKVDEWGNYTIKAKDWKKFLEKMRDDVEKYGASSTKSSVEKERQRMEKARK